jgi:hypothetical protein
VRSCGLNWSGHGRPAWSRRMRSSRHQETVRKRSRNGRETVAPPNNRGRGTPAVPTHGLSCHPGARDTESLALRLAGRGVGTQWLVLRWLQRSPRDPRVISPGDRGIESLCIQLVGTTTQYQALLSVPTHPAQPCPSQHLFVRARACEGVWRQQLSPHSGAIALISCSSLTWPGLRSQCPGWTPHGSSLEQFAPV